MGEKALVESKITDAIQLIHKLDSIGSSPTTAAWYFYDDADEWRLLLAGPTFDALLPKQEPVAYKNVIEAMSSLSLASLGISDLKLIETKNPLPQVLRRLIGTGPKNVVQAHFSNTTLNGIFIKEMVVLRSA
jgi:hypothetical protein